MRSAIKHFSTHRPVEIQVAELVCHLLVMVGSPSRVVSDDIIHGGVNGPLSDRLTDQIKVVTLLASYNRVHHTAWSGVLQSSVGFEEESSVHTLSDDYESPQNFLGGDDFLQRFLKLCHLELVDVRDLTLRNTIAINDYSVRKATVFGMVLLQSS